MTEDRWLQIVSHICDLWPHQPIEPATASAWWPYVQDLDAGDVQEAVRTLALDPDQRYAPTIGQIRAATTGDDATWMDAWMQVARACRGEHGRVHYDGPDPIVAEFCAQLPEWRQHVRPDSTLRAQFRDWWRTRRRQRDQTARRKTAAQIGSFDDRPELPT